MDKKVFRSISYGLYAIGADDDGRPTGCIVNTLFQVTSENPIVAISMNKDNYTYEVLKKSGKFTASIISEKTDPEVIRVLGFSSGKDTDKFKSIKYELVNGMPVICDNCAGYIAAEIISMQNAGTHCIVLGRVLDTAAGADVPPMTYKYYHEVIKGSAPKNAPTYIAPESDEQKVRYECEMCGYIYEGDITKEPDSFRCPVCGAEKSLFRKI